MDSPAAGANPAGPLFLRALKPATDADMGLRRSVYTDNICTSCCKPTVAPEDGGIV